MQIPYSEDAEKFILGRMLSSRNVLDECLLSLDEMDFFIAQHSAIFKCAKNLTEKEIAVEPGTILLELQQVFPDKADVSFIYGLQQYLFGYSESIHGYIKKVKMFSQQRRLINLSTETLKSIQENILQPEEIQSKIMKDLDYIFDGKNLTSSQLLPDLYIKNYNNSEHKFLEYIQKKQEDRRLGISTLPGIPTGYSRLDSLLGGICPGHLIVIGARPGMGKTTFIINLIKNLTFDKNVPVGYFSLEATSDQFLLKYSCLLARVDSQKVELGDITSEEFQRIVTTASLTKEKNTPLYIDEQSSLKTSQVFIRTKRWIKNHGIKVIFIDYFGEIKAEGKFNNKQEGMQEVSLQLRHLAKSLNIAIVLVAQLNRNIETATRKPIKSDLRETGQLEADAHSIIMLYRPEQDDKYNFPGMLQAHIVKNRFGPEGVIHFGFNKQTGEILEMDYKTEVQEALNGKDDFKG